MKASFSTVALSAARRPGLCVLCGILFSLSMGCASTAGFQAPEVPPRLADGTAVPENAAYQPPKPLASFQPQLRSTAGYRGVVEVDAIVDEDGRVSDVLPVSSTNDRLLAKVVDRVRETSFQPATLDGHPVAARYRLTVRVVVQ